MVFSEIQERLVSFGWQITDNEYEIEGTKGLTTFFLSVNESKGIIIINKVTEKKSTISRKEEMIKELIEIANSCRLIIKYMVTKLVTEDEINTVKNLGFTIIMKDICNIHYLVYFPKGRKIPVITLQQDMKNLLSNYAQTFTDSGNCNYAYDLDKKLTDILKQINISDEDVYFIYHYMLIVKKYYENENEEYQGVYKDDLQEIEKIIDIFSNFADK